MEAGEPYTIRIKVPENRGDVVIDDACTGAWSSTPRNSTTS